MRDFDKEKGRIAWNSASKYYASNVKTFIVDKFRTDERISVFREEQWSVLRKQLTSMFKTDCRKTGKKLVNGHDSSTDDDRCHWHCLFLTQINWVPLERMCGDLSTGRTDWRRNRVNGVQNPESRGEIREACLL
jgi:hypothetical protein